MMNVAPTGRDFWGSQRLWSLLDMLSVNAHDFVMLVNVLSEIEAIANSVSDKTAKLDESIQGSIATGQKNIVANCKHLELSVSVTAAETLFSSCKTVDDFCKAIAQVRNTIKFELKERWFYTPLRNNQQYHGKPKLFGEAVFDAFPSANNDIYEAGMCLAFERGTACVMHLMRVVEAGLKCLAEDTLGIKAQADWGAYLREIDEELEKRKKAAGKRTADEQFYAEARVMIDGVRLAWRNPTMHIENSYSPERAEEILIAVRSLMRHLSSRLSEEDPQIKALLS